MTLTREQIAGLSFHVRDHVSVGCVDMHGTLGFASMPDGYELMLNPDRTHYYWLRYDGMESDIDWNKWRVRRGAIANAKAVLPLAGEVAK